MQAIVYELHLLPLKMLMSICKAHLQDVGCLHKGVVRLGSSLLPNHAVYLPFCRQNNSRLDELSNKVSALRGVTINIYDNARSQEVIDSSVG